MSARLTNVSRPDMGTVTYIRNEAPGSVAELTTVSYLWKFLMKVFNFFINIFETWSQVNTKGFWCLVVVIDYCVMD